MFHAWHRNLLMTSFFSRILFSKFCLVNGFPLASAASSSSSLSRSTSLKIKLLIIVFLLLFLFFKIFRTVTECCPPSSKRPIQSLSRRANAGAVRTGVGRHGRWNAEDVQMCSSDGKRSANHGRRKNDDWRRQKKMEMRAWTWMRTF